VITLERWPSLYGQPRLVNLDAEAARIVEAAGNVDEALKDSTEFDRYYFKNAAGDVLLELDWSGRHHCGFAAHLSMYQPHVEDAIDAAARERGADVRQGWRVTGVEQDTDGVTVTALDPTGETTSIRARWLIAADGANSTVRELVGAEREDLGMRSAFLNLDTRRKPAMPDSRLVAPTVTCAPPQMNVIVPIGEERLRIEFEVTDGEDRERLLKPEAAWELLRRWHNIGPDEVEIYRQVIYEFDSRLATQWRFGRVLLAGDAAHLMAPFLGQGACSGLRDAINLAWKLDLVLSGVTGDELLDSYQIERSPHVRTQILTSVAMGQMATEASPEGSAARDQAFLTGHAPPLPPDPTITSGILHRDAAGTLDPVAGELGPQGILRVDGVTGLADQLTGWGFRLITADSGLLTGLTDEHRAALDRIGVDTLAVSRELAASLPVDVQGHYRDFFDRYATGAVLVRPDFVVFGSANTVNEVVALVEDLVTQVERPAVLAER
jgi:3-(3-hydroxy-phenyl)propionate hydroxylase